MKKFCEWLAEEGAPTNVSSGLGIRGLGDVTGTPAGSISNYAAANAADSAKIAATITNNSDGAMGYEGGDTEDQIFRKTNRRKNG